MKGSLRVKVTVLFTDRKPVMNAEVRGDTREYTDEDGNTEVLITSNVTNAKPLVGGNVEVLYEGQKRVQFVEGQRDRSTKLKFLDIDLPPPPAKTHTLTIRSDPEGVASVKPYNVGTHVDIPDKTAIAFHQTSLKSGYTSNGWILNGEEVTTKDLEVVIEKDTEIFVLYNKLGTFYMLETHVEGAGDTRPVPGKADYADGQVVNVQAHPGLGYYLHHFELDGQVTERLEEFTMSKKRSLNVIFRKKHP